MFSLFGFSIQEFFICYFYCQKWPLYVNFNIPPCGKKTFGNFGEFEILHTCT
jgi:hypothetical protein